MDKELINRLHAQFEEIVRRFPEIDQKKRNC